MNKDEYENIRKVYLVEETDLKKQNELLESIVNRLDEIEAKISSSTGNGSEILSAKDVKEDLGISTTTLSRRMYESEECEPLPMVKLGNKLIIRRDKYEAWKQSIGL